MRITRARFLGGLGTAAVALLLTPLARAATREQRQAEIRQMAQQTLARLFQVQPKAKAVLAKSAGHAVFSNFGMKILFAGGGTGSGVAVKTATGKETFMRMVEVQAGLGMGVKKFRLVWVFETAGAFDNFVNSGWELGAQTTAAAQLDGKGAWATGALSVSPGVWLYQLSDEGLALELTAKGTKYYRDGDLN
jgi:lipid-binding SYLF domain-containing protein